MVAVELVDAAIGEEEGGDEVGLAAVDADPKKDVMLALALGFLAVEEAETATSAALRLSGVAI